RCWDSPCSSSSSPGVGSRWTYLYAPGPYPVGPAATTRARPGSSPSPRRDGEHVPARVARADEHRVVERHAALPVAAHHADERAEQELAQEHRVHRLENAERLAARDRSGREVLQLALELAALGVEVRRVVVQLEESDRLAVLDRELRHRPPHDLELLARRRVD